MGPVTFCNSKRWTKEAAEGVQFTVGNGYHGTILHRNQPEELSKRTSAPSVHVPTFPVYIPLSAIVQSGSRGRLVSTAAFPGHLRG